MPIDAKQQESAPVLRASRLDNAHDLGLVRTLFELNGFPRSDNETAWIYEPYHGEAAHGVLAESGGNVAALYATVPARFKCGDRTVLAAQSLDTMVDARFRGLGLFTRMARDAYARMTEHGVSFVYGFPNGNSFHGFVSKLDWSALDPMPFLFRPLDTGYALEKISPMLGRIAKVRIPVLGAHGFSQELHALPQADDVDALWQAFSTRLRVARVRDHAFLDKRYARHPRVRYRYRACYQDGRLAGLIIYCVEDKHGGRIGYVMELMCLPGVDQLASELLAFAAKHRKVIWPGRRELITYATVVGFLPVPTRLRPIELHFGFRALAEPASAELSHRENWYLSYSDSDTV